MLSPAPGADKASSLSQASGTASRSMVSACSKLVPSIAEAAVMAAAAADGDGAALEVVVVVVVSPEES